MGRAKPVAVATLSLAFALAVFSLVITLQARGGRINGDPQRTNLELRLQPTAIRDAIPQVFKFELVNISDHEVYVSLPAIQCEDSFNGSLYFEWRFTPLVSGTSTRDGGGCAGDRFGEWPSILERVKSWKILQPGDSLTVRADRSHLHYKDEAAGKYEFWAIYKPPYVKDIDQQLLWQSGIDSPKASLTSQHLIFRKQP